MGDWTAPDRKRAVQALLAVEEQGEKEKERKSIVAPGAMESYGLLFVGQN